MKNENTNTRYTSIHKGKGEERTKNQLLWLASPLSRVDSKGFSEPLLPIKPSVNLISNLKRIYPFRYTIQNQSVQDYLQNQLYHETKFTY